MPHLAASGHVEKALAVARAIADEGDRARALEAIPFNEA